MEVLSPEVDLFRKLSNHGSKVWSSMVVGDGLELQDKIWNGKPEASWKLLTDENSNKIL